MNPDIDKEVGRLAQSLADLVEEIDLASDEDASAEEIEEARTLADEVLGRYADLLTRLDPDDKAQVQRAIGLKVAKIEGLLTRLRSR